MEKVGTYKILKDKSLVVEYYKGIITLEDLLYLKIAIRNEPDNKLYSDTIIDVRDCDLQINEKDIETFVDFFKAGIKKTGVRKIAYLTSKPNEVVITSLYSYLVLEAGLCFNAVAFSTTEAVVKFFGAQEITEKELTDVLFELKTNSENLYLTQL